MIFFLFFNKSLFRSSPIPRDGSGGVGGCRRVCALQTCATIRLGMVPRRCFGWSASGIFGVMLGLASLVPGHDYVALHGWQHFYSMLAGWKTDSAPFTLPSGKAQIRIAPNAG